MRDPWKVLPWLAVAGGGALLTALFLTRKRTMDVPSPSPLPSPAPPKTYGEAVKVSLSVPTGWRRATSAEVTPELRARANALLDTPSFTSMQYGTLTPFVASDGRTYATWIEQHFHEPGGAAKPWGLHHGVTILASAA